MSKDGISDLISSIKNGMAVGKSRVEVPHSKMKGRILDVLKSEKYIKNYKVEEKDNKKIILVRLNYINTQPAITAIKRVSKPGQRVYKKPHDFRPVLPMTKRGQDCGVTVISTSKGVMTTKDAKKKKAGGEILLTVY
jgi:small subunit ribosomal protein S8